MSRIITFSRYFPAYHPRKGEPTYFVEGILTQLGIKYKTGGYFKWLIENNPEISEVFLIKFFDSLKRDISPKLHTIRNHKRPAVVGGSLNPKCWAGKPYNKTPEGFWQIKFAPDIEIKKVWDVKVEKDNFQNDDGTIAVVTKIIIDGMHKTENYEKLAANDGLNIDDLCNWFNKPMVGQVLCWNENIIYP